jgi:hypothetical protein
MRTINFPLGATELALRSPDNLTTTELEDLILRVSETIHGLSEDLNHNYASSEVTRFNDSDLGFPVSISHKLRDFLYLNLRYYDHTAGNFNPFMANEDFAWPSQSSEIIEFRPEDKIAVRNADIKLTSALLHPHILDVIDQLLREELDLRNFMLSTPTMAVARGNGEWEMVYEVDPTFAPVPVQVNNQAIVLETSNLTFHGSTVVPQTKFFNPFSPGTNQTANYPAVLAAADTMAHAKVVAKQAINLVYPAELQALANQWKSGISVFMVNGNLHNYLPTKSS